MHLPASLVFLNHLNFARVRGACYALIAALAFGWSGAALAVPNPVPGRFEQLREKDLRVASVAYRLAIANAKLCGSVLSPQLGFVDHSIEQYAPADREEAERSFGLGDHVGVMAVVVGSPAEKAGLLSGDRLVAVNGHDLSGTRPAVGDGRRAAVDRAEGILVEEMRQGPVTLRVASPRGERDLRFAAQPGCPSNAEFIPGDEVNAWADGTRVMISDGLLRRCATDDDLALVIGHEMAHNLLHHRRRLAAEGVPVNGLLPLSAAGSQAVRETEEEADRLAVRLATTAAYDLSGAETFIGRLTNSRGTDGMTHPVLSRRLSLLHAAIADAKRGDGPAALGS